MLKIQIGALTYYRPVIDFSIAITNETTTVGTMSVIVKMKQAFLTVLAHATFSVSFYQRVRFRKE